MTTPSEKGHEYDMFIAVSGFCVRLFTHWINWFHELMHALSVVLLGGTVTRIANTRIWFALPDMAAWHIVVLLGFWLEMGAYFAAGMVFARRLAAKASPGMVRARRLVGNASAGLVPAVMLRGLMSEDFERLKDIYPLNQILYVLAGTGLCVMLLYRYYDGTERSAHRTRTATSSSARTRLSTGTGGRLGYPSTTSTRRVPHDAVKCVGW